MTDFELFINKNKLKKKDIASYIGVSQAFISQLVNGSRAIPPDKIALIKANDKWDTSMIKDEQEEKQKKSPIKQRILQFVETLGISKREFYNQVGFSRGTLESESGITEDVMAKFVAKYPAVNIEWLLTGRGDMIPKDNQANLPRAIHSDSSEGIPLIPIEAVAGFGKGDQTGVRYEDCDHYLVPEFIDRGVEFLIRVSGSSMYPKYANGDILACKKIHEILFIQWGKVHIIESISQGVLVKRIFENDAETIRCVSDNKENYPPFLMPKSDIRSLSIVLGVIRLE